MEIRETMGWHYIHKGAQLSAIQTKKFYSEPKPGSDCFPGAEAVRIFSNSHHCNEGNLRTDLRGSSQDLKRPCYFCRFEAAFVGIAEMKWIP